MEQITKITKKEAEITAKLYIASLFALADEFNTDTAYGNVNEFSTQEVNSKVQKEINIQVEKILRNIDYQQLPTTSYDCMAMAKELVKKAKK